MKRLDIVADTYVDFSIKDSTRKSRSMGGTLVFRKDEKMPNQKIWLTSFTAVYNINKTKLNQIIAEHAANPLF